MIWMVSLTRKNNVRLKTTSDFIIFKRTGKRGNVNSLDFIQNKRRSRGCLNETFNFLPGYHPYYTKHPSLRTGRALTSSAFRHRSAFDTRRVLSRVPIFPTPSPFPESTLDTRRVWNRVVGWNFFDLNFRTAIRTDTGRRIFNSAPTRVFWTDTIIVHGSHSEAIWRLVVEALRISYDRGMNILLPNDSRSRRRIGRERTTDEQQESGEAEPVPRACSSSAEYSSVGSDDVWFRKINKHALVPFWLL